MNSQCLPHRAAYGRHVFLIALDAKVKSKLEIRVLVDRAWVCLLLAESLLDGDGVGREEGRWEYFTRM